MGQSFKVYRQCTVRAALEAAAFVDIYQQDFEALIGGWPKDAYQKFPQDPEGCLVFWYMLWAGSVSRLLSFWFA